MDKKKLEYYKSLGLKLTPQRLGILKFLENNKNHPSAEDIYNALKDQFPSMSLATVYNTLDVLVEKGIVKELIIESSKRRFDPYVYPHAHFICKKCKKIIDVNMEKNLSIPEELKDMEIVDINLTFYGYCKDCQKKSLDK